MKRKAVVVFNGCPTCRAMMKGGLCKNEQCIEITTAAGQAIAKKAKLKSAPACVTIDTKTGAVKKCDVTPFLKKYLPR